MQEESQILPLKLKRKVEVAIISDIHLGTYGCHAKQLLTYLNSIQPKKLILNGNIIDIWQLKTAKTMQFAAITNIDANSK